MQAISVLGPGSDSVAEALADRLEGRVALLEGVETASEGTVGERTASEGTARGETTGDDEPVADAVFALSPDGAWTGAGTDRELDDLLEALAPDFEYLVASGHTRLRLPTVLLGDEYAPADVPGDVVREVAVDDDDALLEAVDVDELAGIVDDLEPWVTLAELVARVKASPGADRSGAIATFTGRVRAKDAPDDPRTSHLAFEKYEGVAADRMETIAGELEDREGVFEVLMHHRTGVIPDGEDIVFVVVLAGHRREAFETVEDGIDRLKEVVPIFKKETTEAEEFWVHQREPEPHE